MQFKVFALSNTLQLINAQDPQQANAPMIKCMYKDLYIHASTISQEIVNTGWIAIFHIIFVDRSLDLSLTRKHVKNYTTTIIAHWVENVNFLMILKCIPATIIPSANVDSQMKSVDILMTSRSTHHWFASLTWWKDVINNLKIAQTAMLQKMFPSIYHTMGLFEKWLVYSTPKIKATILFFPSIHIIIFIY